MMSRISTPFLACMLGVVPGAYPLEAQSPGELTTGDGARNWATRGGTSVGAPWAPPSHSLLIPRHGGAAVEALPVATVEALRGAQGRTRVSRSIAIGGLTGFLVGGAVGAVLAYEDCTANGSESCMGLEPWQIAGITGVVFGIPTGLLGAAIGAWLR